MRALALAFLLLLPALAQPPTDESLLRRNIHMVRVDLNARKAELEAANSEEKRMADELGLTQTQLEDFSRRLREVRTALRQAQTRLDLLQRSVRVTQGKLRRSQQALERRLRGIYEDGETNYLAVLLQSTSFTDFINQTEYLQRIIQTDQELIGQVRAQKAELERQKTAAQRTVVEIKGLKREFEEKVTGLAAAQERQASVLAQLQTHRRKLESKVESLEHLSVDMEHRLSDLIRERTGPPGAVPVSAGRYMRPVEGPVLSGFGYRVHPITGSTRFHSGLDFGVDHGTPIRAADNGVVIYASWYGGYGNCVIIKHGGDYSTLYGHCSELYVREGQQVRQGTTIAAVGSTGMSTGPHLHFEVRQNGTPVDPMSRI